MAGPVIDDPMPGDLHRVEIVLDPSVFIRGHAEPGLTSIRVAFCCASPTDSDPTGLSITTAAIPQGQAMWFLRWSAAPLPTALDVGQQQTPTAYDRAT